MASGFSPYCAGHRANLRRHGEPEQKAITKAQVRPYQTLVRARIAKNPHNPAWTALETRWRALVDHAEHVIAEYERGRAGSQVERLVAREIVKLGNTTEPRIVVEVTMAMVMLREFRPCCFRSDHAFWVQLGRRVRGLSDLNFGERYVHATGKVKRCYRELSPRAAVVLGRWLAETLGIGGLYLARLDRAEHEKQNAEQRDLHKALAQLS
ncbi:hypothetical protein [Hyphomicrobium sp. D-2]|uniref:hypothetical protein n=1 Tax=Hyphomicrobium sp. D-2 TaxID=3041621 RepID=UPI002453E687|nr:hypothetical protein [Hyphomicrobium sp. D-2]MDH4981872.1 hypothetical protein [Hyphomicrobium sp. D-2]